MYYLAEEHPNLLFSQEVYNTIHTDEHLTRNEKLMGKIMKALDSLNAGGTVREYHTRGNLEPLGDGWWSLRIIHNKNYWRVMFRRTDSNQYGLTNMFLKKENKITKKHWDTAKRVAKREGWL
ncbi:type II toxin-antitoxin system RelE/ParE family toxin [Bacillus paramycoides]|uniref:type II toxin-antitoxin system RelE/ParE family toxin n=1 Tax=Bacillus paramycoides TaxID=2026194 RepID=UPI0040582FBD